MLHIRLRRTVLALSVAAFLLLPALARAIAQTSSPGWTLVWSDEFNGVNGSSPDPAKWTVVTGGNGFGNDELEYYTARSENIHQEDGNLVITARKENFTGTDNVARSYTSARIETKGHFETQYGRLEARIKIPRGQGMWPAFWAMGSNFDQAGWPDCGEMDIMENIGREPSMVHGTLHGPGYSGGTPLTGAYTLPNGARVGDGFHIFAVEWEPETVRFYVDGVLTETKSASDVPGKLWAFDHPFFILFNLAVGGNWPGDPDANTVFPATMLVDYVRVYRRADTVPENSTANR